MPTKAVQKKLGEFVRPKARKAEILTTLQTVCQELGRMSSAIDERPLYDEVAQFLGREIRRLKQETGKRSRR